MISVLCVHALGCVAALPFFLSSLGGKDSISSLDTVSEFLLLNNLDFQKYYKKEGSEWGGGRDET